MDSELQTGQTLYVIVETSISGHKEMKEIRFNKAAELIYPLLYPVDYQVTPISNRYTRNGIKVRLLQLWLRSVNISTICVPAAKYPPGN